MNTIDTTPTDSQVVVVDTEVVVSRGPQTHEGQTPDPCTPNGTTLHGLVPCEYNAMTATPSTVVQTSLPNTGSAIGAMVAIAGLCCFFGLMIRKVVRREVSTPRKHEYINNKR